MISTLNGKIAAREPPMLVVDCGGIGYEVWAPMPVFEKIGETESPVRLYIHPVYREDSQTLYGFLAAEERRFFRAMLKVNGVGAKSALAVMSVAMPAQINAALQAGDPSLLLKAPGIGKKTAERIVMELRGAAFAGETGAAAGPGQSDVEKALLSLGFSQKEVRGALAKLPPESAQADLEERIRMCLRILSK